MDLDLRVGEVDLSALRPTGEVLTVRDEWLCELRPSRRLQVRVASPFDDAAKAFAASARVLSAELEKWGPRRKFLRARGAAGSWVVVLHDASTDAAKIAEAVFDFRAVSEADAREGARLCAAGHKELAPFLPLWTERGLPILMTSVEASKEGLVQATVQLGLNDGTWAGVLKWLEASGFTRVADDKWARGGSAPLSVLLGSGKIWASFGAPK